MRFSNTRLKLSAYGLIFLLAIVSYRELVYWVPETLFLPSARGWFFLLSDSSPHLLYLLAAGLLIVQHKYLTSAFRKSSSGWPGLIILVLALCAFTWGHYVNAIDHIHLSFLMALIGSAWLISGKALVKAILIPVIILFLGTPIPAVLINQIVFPFQIWAAEHTVWLLQLARVPSVQEGDLIYLWNANFRVIETCTALGFMKWLITFALAYAYLFQLTRIQTILLVIAAPLIAYGINLLRIISLIYDPDIKLLASHMVQGVLFFMVGFVLLHLTSVLLERCTPTQIAEKETCNNPEDSLHTGHLSFYPALTITIFLSYLLLISVLLPRTPEPLGTATKDVLPDRIGDWQFESDIKRNGMLLGTLQYKHPQYKWYKNSGSSVNLFTAYDERIKRNRSFYSEKNAYPGEIGITRERYEFSINDIQTTALVTEYENIQVLSYHWYDGVESTGNDITHALLAFDQSPYRRQEIAKFTRVAIAIPAGPDGRQLAEKGLADFLEQLVRFDP